MKVKRTGYSIWLELSKENMIALRRVLFEEKITPTKFFNSLCSIIALEDSFAKEIIKRIRLKEREKTKETFEDKNLEDFNFKHMSTKNLYDLAEILSPLNNQKTEREEKDNDAEAINKPKRKDSNKNNNTKRKINKRDSK